MALPCLVFGHIFGISRRPGRRGDEKQSYTRTIQGVSWLDYPTLPSGFQTGHPDRMVQTVMFQVHKITSVYEITQKRKGTHPVNGQWGANVRVLCDLQ